MPVVIAEKLDPASPGIDSLHPPESRSDRSATRGDFRRRFGPPVYGLLRKGKCGVEAVPLAASHRARTRQSRRTGRGAGDPEGAPRRAWLLAPATAPAGSRYHLSARGQAAHQPRPAEANFRALSLPGTSRGIIIQRVRSRGPLREPRKLKPMRSHGAGGSQVIPLGTGMPGPQSSRSERAGEKACGTSRSVKYLGEAAFFGAAAKTWRAWVAWLSACSWACPSTAVARRRVKWTSRRRPTFAIRTRCGSSFST